jgi:hypothetical protein
MKPFALFVSFFLFCTQLFAQVGIASPNSNATLDLSSKTKGLLLPGQTNTQRDIISSPTESLMVYNTTSSAVEVYANESNFILLGSTAYAAKSCEALKAEIEAILIAKGVRNFTLTIVPNDQVGIQKVVGSCEGGSKKIIYKRN